MKVTLTVIEVSKRTVYLTQEQIEAILMKHVELEGGKMVLWNHAPGGVTIIATLKDFEHDEEVEI